MNEILKCKKTSFILVEDYKDLSLAIGNLGPNVLWICDSNTARMVRPLPEPNLILEAGDSVKNIQSLERILSEAYENRFDKNSYFLAMGGGSLCDLTGLAAAIFHHGSKLVFIPTTLQAMADAVLGGETSINFKNTKNLIGTDYPADKVIICPELLKSLSNKEFNNGISEIIKYGLLTCNEEIFRMLSLYQEKINERDKETISSLIIQSLLAKKDCIESPDELKREALDLGHTFAYALESFRNVSHGEAVAWGIGRSLLLSLKLNLCTEEYCNKVLKLINNYGFDSDYRISRTEWQNFRYFLLNDNKRFDGKLYFILSTGQGTFVKEEVSEEIIKELIIRGPGE